MTVLSSILSPLVSRIPGPDDVKNAPAGPLPFLVDAALYDGVNDYANRGGGLTGAADAAGFALSCWVDFAGGDGVVQTLLKHGSDVVNISRGADNLFSVYVANTAETTRLQIKTVSTIIAANGWAHILASGRLDAGAGAKTKQLYRDDVLDMTVVDDVGVADVIDFTAADWVFSQDTLGAHASKVNGAIAEFWFTNVFIDFSVQANRRKFRDAAGKPVNLGANGELPLAAQPLVFFHLADGEAPANFMLNRGAGGNFILTGGLATAASSPSD